MTTYTPTYSYDASRGEVLASVDFPGVAADTVTIREFAEAIALGRKRWEGARLALWALLEGDRRDPGLPAAVRDRLERVYRRIEPMPASLFSVPTPPGFLSDRTAMATKDALRERLLPGEALIAELVFAFPALADPTGPPRGVKVRDVVARLRDGAAVEESFRQGSEAYARAGGG